MNFSKVEKQLKKINKMVDMASVDGQFSAIEKDLLLSYIRKFYETILLDSDHEANNIKVENQKPAEPKVESSKEPEVPSKEVIEEPYEQEKQIISNEIVAEPVQKSIDTSRYDSIFELNEIDDLSSKLSKSKINDINKAIGINERIFTIRELFGNDSEVYNSTLNKLQNLGNFNEAKSFLASEVIPTYEWDDEKRIKKAQNFIKVVRRLY